VEVDVKLFIIFVGISLVAGCCVFHQSSESGHDVQFVKIFLHIGRHDELDTFRGTYQKDLIPGTVKTTMWLTTREQEIILTASERYRFFSLPDTIYERPANEHIYPDLGLQVLRIKYKDRDKTVVWDSPIPPRNKSGYFIESIVQIIEVIIESKPEYKALPHRKGLYSFRAMSRASG
jgi:hypothetical protein